MSVRLFAGYFLALAACAIVAFGSSEPEPTVTPFSAEAGMMPKDMIPKGIMPKDFLASPNASFSPSASFSLRPHKISMAPVPKRVQVADAR